MVIDPYSKTYLIHELTSEASQQLLEYREHTGPGVKLTLEQKNQVAHLTGNVPLALHIMKSLLDRVGSPSPSQLISELEKEPIETLSPKDFQSQRQIKATLDLSFRYLEQQWQVIACQLILFPGSFAEDAAVFVLSNGSKSDNSRKKISESLRYLVRHSLLSHDQRKNRYQYHQLIKEYLVHIQSDTQSGSLAKYLSSYYVYYANLLMTAYIEFREKFEVSIAIVNSDRHNFQHILNGLKTMQMPAAAKEFLDTAIAVSGSVSIGLLDVRFRDNDTYRALENALIQFDWMVDNGMYYERSQTVFQIYVLIMKLVSNHEKMQHGVKAGFHILTQRIEHIESNQELILSEVYINFFEQVCSYCSQLGFELETKLCELRIFMKTNVHLLTCLKTLKLCHMRRLTLPNVDLSTCLKREHCTYDTVGISYYELGEYHTAASLLELALETDKGMNSIDKAHVLIYLMNSYSNLKEHKQVLKTTNRLYALHESIMNMTASECFWHANTVANLVRVYEEQGFVSEAGELFEKILRRIHKEIKILVCCKENATQSLTFMNMYSMLQEFYNNKDYQKVTNIATDVIVAMNEVEATQPGVLPNKLKLQLLIGKAKFQAKNYSDGLRDIERVLETILGLPNGKFEDEDKVNACWQLFPRIVYAEACYNIKANTLKVLIHYTVLFFRYTVFFFFDPTIHRLTILASDAVNNLREILTSFATPIEVSHATELASTTAAFNGFDYVSQTDFYILWQRMMDWSKYTMLILLRALLHLCVLLLQLLILILNFVNKFCILDILLSWGKLMILYGIYLYKRDRYLFTFFITDLRDVCNVIEAVLYVLWFTLVASVNEPRKSGNHLLMLPLSIVNILCYVRDPRFKYGVLYDPS